jgi:cytokinin dehydrogenase
VLRATLAQGKTPPGGVGGTTSAFGVQSDNMIDMEVVTGEGKKVTFSASNNADLSNAVRAGLGQGGVITKATLKLVAAPESVRRFLLSYPDLATMLRDERLLSADNRFDAVQGAIAAAPSGGLAFRLDATKNVNGDPPEDNVLLAGMSDDPGPTAAHDDRVLRLPQPVRRVRGDAGRAFDSDLGSVAGLLHAPQERTVRRRL